MLIILFACVLFLFSCSLDYGTNKEEDFVDIPQIVVEGYVHTVVENGTAKYKIEAEKGESYTSQNKMKLSNLNFTEFSAKGNGEVTAEGKADSATIFTTTESAEMSGDVSFKEKHDGLTVKSEFLKWDGENRKLESRDETITSITKSDGSYLTGSGFSADAARRSFTFQNRADGSFHSNSEVTPESDSHNSDKNKKTNSDIDRISVGKDE